LPAACFGRTTVGAAAAVWFPSVVASVVVAGVGAGSSFFAALCLPDLVPAARFGPTVDAVTAFWFPSVASVVVATGAGACSGFFAALFLPDLMRSRRPEG
jgi:hypothetical protein